MSVNHEVDVKRTVTGLIMAAVVVGVLCVRGLPMLLLIMLVAALGLWEFFSLFWGKTGRIPTRCCAILLGWGMLLLTWMHRPQDALVCLGAGFVLAAISFLFRWRVVEEAFEPSGIFMAGLAYVPLLLLPATYLSNVRLIFIIAAVAISDTCAYFIGSRYGRHKLWPSVSPNKSSEGAVASLVGCVIFCMIYGAFFGKVSVLAFLPLGIAVNAFAQLGDLLSRRSSVLPKSRIPEISFPATAACSTERTVCSSPCPCSLSWTSGSSSFSRRFFAWLRYGPDSKVRASALSRRLLRQNGRKGSAAMLLFSVPPAASGVIPCLS